MVYGTTRMTLTSQMAIRGGHKAQWPYFFAQIVNSFSLFAMFNRSFGHYLICLLTVLPPKLSIVYGKPFHRNHAIILLSLASSQGDGNPLDCPPAATNQAIATSQKTLLEDWRELTQLIEKNVPKITECQMQFLQEHESALRSQLRDSIEEIRETLLNSTNDPDVRRVFDQKVMDTRRELKQQLRQVRDQEAESLLKAMEVFSKMITQLDLYVAPIFNTIYNRYTSWEKFVADIVKAVPQLEDIFLMATILASEEPDFEDLPDDVIEKLNGLLSQEQHNADMDQFQADMEDRLEDLKGDIKFQIRIGAGAGKKGEKSV